MTLFSHFHTISYTLYDYISFLHVSLSLFTLNLRGKSYQSQSTSIPRVRKRENELLRGREWTPCDFPFLLAPKECGYEGCSYRR